MTTFEAKDDQFEARVKASFARQQAMKTLGIEITGFLFRARVVKPGRTITVCDARAFAVDAGQEKLVATMTGTLMALFERSDISH